MNEKNNKKHKDQLRDNFSRASIYKTTNSLNSVVDFIWVKVGEKSDADTALAKIWSEYPDHSVFSFHGAVSGNDNTKREFGRSIALLKYIKDKSYPKSAHSQKYKASEQAEKSYELLINAMMEFEGVNIPNLGDSKNVLIDLQDQRDIEAQKDSFLGRELKKTKEDLASAKDELQSTINKNKYRADWCDAKLSLGIDHGKSMTIGLARFSATKDALKLALVSYADKLQEQNKNDVAALTEFYSMLENLARVVPPPFTVAATSVSSLVTSVMTVPTFKFDEVSTVEAKNQGSLSMLQKATLAYNNTCLKFKPFKVGHETQISAISSVKLIQVAEDFYWAVTEKQTMQMVEKLDIFFGKDEVEEYSLSGDFAQKVSFSDIKTNAIDEFKKQNSEHFDLTFTPPDVKNLSLEIELMLYCKYIQTVRRDFKYGMTNTLLYSPIAPTVIQRLRTVDIGLLHSTDASSNSNHTFSSEKQYKKKSVDDCLIGKLKYTADEDHDDILLYVCTWIIENINPFAIGLRSVQIESVKKYRAAFVDKVNLEIIQMKLDIDKGFVSNAFSGAKQYLATKGARTVSWDTKKVINKMKQQEKDFEKPEGL